MNLYKSPVVFNPEGHSYTLNGKSLSGITSLIKKHICPDKYKDIPLAVLNKAAERGTIIHETCELIDDLGIQTTIPEARAYTLLREECKLNYLCSEYLVSDEQDYATCIDKVFTTSDTTVELSDIKTTSTLDETYLTWQLSIGAYLFERQNPDIKVTRLSAIWLRADKSEYRQIQRLPDAEVVKLLDADRTGELYTPPSDLIRKETSLELPSDLISEITAMVRQAEEATKRLEELKAGLLQQMKANNVKSFDCDAFKLTYIAETSSETFDSKAFRKDNEELFERYKKVTKRKPTLKISLK